MFLKIFEDSSLPGTLGIKFFRKICPKTRSKHVWILSGTILGIFDICEFCDFQESFRRLDPPWNTGHKNFQKNFPQNMFKTRLDTFGNTFGHFWNFEPIIFENFRKLDTPRNTGPKKNFEKFAPKHVQNPLGYFREGFWAFLEF